MKKHGSFVVLFKDDAKQEVFLVLRSNYPIWVITGGGVEKGESPKKAALREAKEETSFKVKIVRKVGVYTRKQANSVYKSNLFEGRVISGKFKPEFPGCKGEWFPINKLPFSTTSKTKERIFDCIEQKSDYFNKKSKRFWVLDNLHLMLLHPKATIKLFVKSIS
ncbi:MAG: NUDIX hydrolase [Patescibacteria group bacterium]